MKTLACSVLASLGGFVATQAGVLSTSLAVHMLIPDGDASGLVSALHLPGPPVGIADVNVTLRLRGGAFSGWNGDLYAWLSHDTGFSVLLNRPGRTVANPLGYADNGLLDVVLDDQAAQGDIHFYQLTLGLAHVEPAPLGGAWAPDGRVADPDLVSELDTPAALLAGFNGLNASGDWTLFIADLGAGGELTLEEWGLVVTSVPEPGWAALGAALTCGVWALRRGRR